MSFLKKVAKVALPFASLIAAPFTGGLSMMGLGSLGGRIALGAGLGGGILSNVLNRGGGKKKGDPLQEQLMAMLGQQQQLSKQFLDMGQPLITSGASNLNQSGDYYKALLAGGPAQQKALAGPMSDLATGYGQAKRQTAAFAPYGSTASAYADYGRKMASDAARLRFDAQGQGAQGLAGIGSTLLGGGTALATQGRGSLADATGTGLGLTSAGLQRDAISAQKWGGFGEGIGNLLGVLLGPGGILNKGGKG